MRRILPAWHSSIATGTVLALTAVALAVPARPWAPPAPAIPGTSPGALNQRSYIYAADGSLMATLKGEENRQPVALDQVPPHVIAAILAVEDAGFFVHDGFDVRGMIRAFKANVDSGGISQGGSTITQQLVKLDEVGSEQTLDRKMQEIFLASRLEKDLTKEEILHRYLNTVYFGNHAYASRPPPRPTSASASSSSTWARRRCWPASSATRSATTRPATPSGRPSAATSPSSAWSRSGR